MGDKIRSPIVIFVVLVLISLSLAGIGFSLLQKEKAQTVTLRQQVDDLNIKQRIAETKLEEYKNTITQLESKLKNNQAMVDSLTSDLEKEKLGRQRVQEEVEQLKADLEKQKGFRSDLEIKLTETQKDVEKTQAQLKELEDRKSELEEKIKKLEVKAQEAQAKDVQLGTIVVNPEAEAPLQQAPAPRPRLRQPETQLEGKVLVVNREYNFVVINLGAKDGISVGELFSLYHNNKYIGDLKVGKTHDSMSAADFISASAKDLASEGDRVVQKTE